MRILALTFILLTSAEAATMPRGLKADGPAVKVVAVDDGDTLALADGRTVRLVGIQAPKIHDKRMLWPFSAEAKTALTRLALNQPVTLYYGQTRFDRHGRVLAHPMRRDGLWLQAEMLRLGMARVYSFPDNRAGVRALLEAEATARATKRGIWAHPFYAVRNAASFADAGRIGWFEIVRGRVTSAKLTRDGLHLDFGADWRSDFSVRIAKSRLRSLPKPWREEAFWPGKLVESRGWIYQRNGLMLDVTHADQLILEPLPHAAHQRPPRRHYPSVAADR